MENQDRLVSLTSSSTILLMRRSLRSAGWWSIFWGVIWLGVLLMEVSSGTAGWINYAWFGVGGALLIAEGIFVITRFSSIALKAEAITLAAFGALNLFNVAMMAAGKSHGRANPLFGVIMLFNAFTTWKASATVDQLMSQTSEQDLGFMTQVVDGMMKENPKNSPDLVAMKQSGIVVSNPEWRLKILDGTAYLVNLNPGVFGTAKRAVSIDIIPAKSIQLDISGETWTGTKSKCKLVVDGQITDKKFEIERSMLEKLQMQGIASSAAMG